MVKSIQHITFAAWFEAIASPSFVDAPRTFHKMFVAIQNFDFQEEETASIQKVVNNNSYNAHFESVVICMLHDPEPEIRQKGLQECLQVLQREEEEKSKVKRKPRKNAKAKKKVREYVCPKLDLASPVAHYWNFIDYIPASQKTMPPVLIGMSAEELKAFAEDPDNPDSLKLRPIPGNTQNVERVVQRVAQISEHVKLPERLEQEICLFFYSLVRMPHIFNSKQDYRSHL